MQRRSMVAFCLGLDRPAPRVERIAVPSGDTDLKFRLFVYGSLMSGERDHALLARAKLLGPANTAPRYTLVDLAVYPALLNEGTTSVVGELYLVDAKTRFDTDVKKECPVLFQRVQITLDDGTTADAYCMAEDKVRGRRRIKNGSWKERTAPAARPRR
jgi:gamma-glutamylaminecyclotransferase